MSPHQESEKAMAAAAAVAEVRDGMLVGLGTGSTAAYAIREIATKVQQGLQITATATSLATERLAREFGVPLRPFDEIAQVDLTIDGADEIDASLRAVKGGGGALLREKIVAAASQRTIIIADSTKLVPVLGAGHQLPIEVLPFASAFVEHTLGAAGFRSTKRLQHDGLPALTDQQNHLFDIETGPISEPAKLAAWLIAIPGVIEHGLFLSEIDELWIAESGAVRVIRR